MQTAVGVLPKKEELNLEGCAVDPDDLDKILSIDGDRWRQEMGFRAEHPGGVRPAPRIWEAHRRVEKGPTSEG